MSAAEVSCQDKYALNPKKNIIGPLLISHWLNHAYISPHTRYFMLSNFFQLFRRIVAKAINSEIYTNIGHRRKSCLSTILQY